MRLRKRRIKMLDDAAYNEVGNLLSLVANRELANDLSDWERNFFKSLLEKYEKYGKKMFLSDKEYNKLEELASTWNSVENKRISEFI